MWLNPYSPWDTAWGIAGYLPAFVLWMPGAPLAKTSHQTFANDHLRHTWEFLIENHWFTSIKP